MSIFTSLLKPSLQQALLVAKTFDDKIVVFSEKLAKELSLDVEAVKKAVNVLSVKETIARLNQKLQRKLAVKSIVVNVQKKLKQSLRHSTRHLVVTSQRLVLNVKTLLPKVTSVANMKTRLLLLYLNLK